MVLLKNTYNCSNLMRNTFPAPIQAFVSNNVHPFYRMMTLCLHNALIFSDITPFGSQRWDDFRQLILNPFGVNCLEIDISVGANGENVISHRDQLLMGLVPNPVSGALSLDAMVPWLHTMIEAGQFSSGYPLVLSMDVSQGVNFQALTEFFVSNFLTYSSSLRIVSTDESQVDAFQYLSHSTGIPFVYNGFKQEAFKINGHYYALKDYRRPGKMKRLLEREGTIPVAQAANESQGNWSWSFFESTFFPTRFTEHEIRQIVELAFVSNRSLLMKFDHLKPIPQVVYTVLSEVNKQIQHRLCRTNHSACSARHDAITRSMRALPWQSRALPGDLRALLVPPAASNESEVGSLMPLMKPLPGTSLMMPVVLVCSLLLTLLIANSELLDKLRIAGPLRERVKWSGALLFSHALFSSAALLYSFSAYALLGYSLPGFYTSAAGVVLIATLGLILPCLKLKSDLNLPEGRRPCLGRIQVASIMCSFWLAYQGSVAFFPAALYRDTVENAMIFLFSAGSPFLVRLVHLLLSRLIRLTRGRSWCCLSRELSAESIAAIPLTVIESPLHQTSRSGFFSGYSEEVDLPVSEKSAGVSEGQACA